MEGFRRGTEGNLASFRQQAKEALMLGRCVCMQSLDAYIQVWGKPFMVAEK